MASKYRHLQEREERPLPGRRAGRWKKCLPALALALVVGGGCLMTQLPRVGAAQVAQDGGSAAVTKKEETSLPQGEETASQAGAAPEEANSLWYLTLVNFETPIDPDFQPPLTWIQDGTQRFDSRAAGALEVMLADMKDQGLSPIVCSGYRTRETQEGLYKNQVDFWLGQGYDQASAEAEAALLVARPDTSEHQLGLAADIVSAGNQILDESQEQTPEQQWLLSHCQEYGFILRYPSGKTELTGVSYEPWHYRYVGVEAAGKIMAQGLCLEEYLEGLSP